MPPVEIAPPRARSLEEIAVENAVEGCVAETWGALVTGWQSRTATDRAVRRAMATIAEDETSHVELAWAVAAWLDPLLEEDARLRVRAARVAAAHALAKDVDVELTAAHRETLGLPCASIARRLVEEMRATLWS